MKDPPQRTQRSAEVHRGNTYQLSDFENLKIPFLSSSVNLRALCALRGKARLFKHPKTP
jgi:hypothetical protein